MPQGFQKGNKHSPGRKKGSLNKFTQVKHDLIDIWNEDCREKIKEMVKQRGKNDVKWLTEVITKLLPKDINLGNRDGEALHIIISDKLLPERKGNGENGGGDGKDTPDT